METTKQTIERIQMDLDVQEAQIKMFDGCIERCNYIVEVGAYTLACGENNKAEYVLKLTPTQWTKEAAIANAEMLMKGEVNEHIRVVDKLTWYKEQIEVKRHTLEVLEKIAELEINTCVKA